MYRKKISFTLTGRVGIKKKGGHLYMQLDSGKTRSHGLAGPVSEGLLISYKFCKIEQAVLTLIYIRIYYNYLITLPGLVFT